MNTEAMRESPKGRRFVFDGVTVEESTSRLIVDGRERICSQRAFRLLVTMCESGGQVVSKQQVIDKLWPGGQVVSDEALTQIVFRARNCLDRYASRLVTVRGIGLRLDAVVREEDGAVPLPPEPIEAAAPTEIPEEVAPAQARDESITPPAPVLESVSGPVAPSRRLPGRGRMAWLLGALAIGLLVWLVLRGGGGGSSGSDSLMLDHGWGLTVADLHAARADSAALLREAFSYEGRGDRARARALMETVHESDTATPIPAQFLALWAVGGGDARRADQWLEQARERMQPIVSPPLTALMRYIEAERSANPQDVLRYAGAVLDIRPSAWQLRLARAHLLEGGNLREAALEELKRIDVTSLNHRKLAMALADRASLGDLEGAQAHFEQVRDGAAEQSAVHFLRGRFAWTRQDWPAAEEAFAQAQEAARRELRFDLEHRAAVNRGAIAVQQGDVARAIDLLDAARRGMIENQWVYDEIDLALMLAQLHALQGDLVQTGQELDKADEALARSHAPELRNLLAIYRLRLLPDVGVMPAAQADDDIAFAAIAEAWMALRNGDQAAAVGQFQSAQRRVLPTSPLHDEVRLLAKRLGQVPEAPYRVDPPYPPLARLTTRLAAETSTDGPAP
jgi:DNA-binding winged helix-turn-helix (wHTH) protein/tetratricopeptide (TPR) repeat protein